MVAADASAHNFFRRLICPRTTVARTCFYPITGVATSSPPCFTSSLWRSSPVSTRGRGPPEALTCAPVWRHNSNRRGPRLPSCARNSVSRTPARLRFRLTGTCTIHPRSAARRTDRTHCHIRGGTQASAGCHAETRGLKHRRIRLPRLASIAVRHQAGLPLPKNLASPLQHLKALRLAAKACRKPPFDDAVRPNTGRTQFRRTSRPPTCQSSGPANPSTYAVSTRM